MNTNLHILTEVMRVKWAISGYVSISLKMASKDLKIFNEQRDKFLTCKYELSFEYFEFSTERSSKYYEHGPRVAAFADLYIQS
jgi:hypothetical protein